MRGNILSGEIDVNITLPAQSYKYEDIILYVDGSPVDIAGDSIRTTNGVPDVRMSIAADEYPNGTHEIRVTDKFGRSDSLTVSFYNTVANIFAEPIFDTDIFSNDVPLQCQITATLTTAQPWVVEIRSTTETPSVVRTFSGNSGAINVSWNGFDTSGNEVENDEYEVRLTFAQNPGQNRTKTVNKKRRGDAFILIDKGTMGEGSQSKEEREQIRYTYKNFVLSRLRPLRGTTFTNINYMAYSTKDFGRLQTATAIRQAVINQLSTPLQLLYVNGHGGEAPNPFFGLGPYTFYSHIDEDDDDLRGIGGQTDLRAINQSLGYGSSIDPPGLVWIDSCDSAPSGSNQNAFGVSYSSGANGYGVFLGWKGSCNFYGVFAPPDDAWDFWRRQLWEELFVGHQNFQTAINRTNTRTSNRGFGQLGDDNPVAKQFWSGGGTTGF